MSEVRYVPDYRVPVTEAEFDMRCALVAEHYESLGVEVRPAQIAGLVEDTDMIALDHLRDALRVARQASRDGFPPRSGEVIEAWRQRGRWHNADVGREYDPYWHRCWTSRSPVQPDPREPHAPERVKRQKQLRGGAHDQPLHEMEAEARRDIAAHARHLREGLKPDECVRCVLEQHKEHTKPVENCWRCQILNVGRAA